MKRSPEKQQEGAALIVALWVLVMLALLVSSISYDMQVEASVTSYYRQRFKAQHLSRAGVEWAKMFLVQSQGMLSSLEDEMPELDLQLKILRRGVAVRGYRHEMEDGFFELDIVPESSRRNINLLVNEPDDLREIFDQANITDIQQQNELIGALTDWIDEDDFTSVNGAESDDPFYIERGYKVKNAPLDSIDELLLIKGFTESVVFGGPAEVEGDPPYLGIARWLTVWGDGRVNVNSATAEVLLTLPELDEWMVQAIIDGRAGLDGEFGTDDDGFTSVEEVIAITGADPSIASKITVDDRRFVRVVSVGESNDVRSGTWVVFRQQGAELTPVFWREELMP